MKITFSSISLNIQDSSAVGRGKALQAGLIPGGVIGIFHLPNPSGRNVALGSTASKRNGCDWCVGLTTLPPSRGDCVESLSALSDYSRKGLSSSVLRLLSSSQRKYV